MCSSKALLAALGLVFLIHGTASAEPAILTAPRKPFAFAGGIPAGPEDKVWSAVVLASNCKKGEQPVVAPPELAPYVRRLSKIFGCAQFEVLGSAVKIMDEQNERWLVPTKNFWVRVRSKRSGEGYVLNMELFHDARSLVKFDAMLGPESPLFVRGPVHARGQIILVFEIKP